MNEVDKNCANAGWALFFFVSVTIASEILIELAGRYFNISEWIETIILLVVPTYIMGFAAFSGVICHIPNTNKKEKKKISIGIFLTLVIISFGAMYFFNMIGTAFTMYISYSIGRPIENPVDILADMDVITVGIFAGLVAPVMEELIYRKLLLGKLRRYGEKNAVIYTALMFGLMHGNFSQFFYAFALGLILGYVYIKTNDIKYSIALHMIINICGGVIFPQAILSGNPIAVVFLGVFVIIIMVVGVILFALNVNKIKFDNDNEERVPAIVFYKNIGTALYALICSIMFVMTIL